MQCFLLFAAISNCYFPFFNILFIFCIKSYDNEFSGLIFISTFHLIFNVFWCRGCFDVFEDDAIASSPRDVDQENGRNESECSGQSSFLPHHVIPEHKFFSSGSLPLENALSPKKVIGDGDR